MNKINIILGLVFFILFSLNSLAIVIPDYNGTATLIDRDYILGTGLVLYNHLPYLFTGGTDLIRKYLTGTSIADSLLGRNTNAQINGVTLTLSDAEYKVYESIQPFVGDKLGIILNVSSTSLLNGNDPEMQSYYAMKEQQILNINIMWDYLISLFIILKEIFTILIQLFIFLTAVFVFVELLPTLFVFIKKKMVKFTLRGVK